MYCPRCQKEVETWEDYYVEDKVKVTTTLCAMCNAILKVEHKKSERRQTVNQKGLEERIGDLLAKQWEAVKSAEFTDIPTIAAYIAANIAGNLGETVPTKRQPDCLQRARELALMAGEGELLTAIAKRNTDLALIYGVIAIAERLGMEKV